MYIIKSIRGTILVNLYLFNDLQEVKEFALNEFDKRRINAIISFDDDDDGYDISDYVNTKHFLLWLLKPSSECHPEWFLKACTFELLRLKE